MKKVRNCPCGCFQDIVTVKSVLSIQLLKIKIIIFIGISFSSLINKGLIFKVTVHFRVLFALVLLSHRTQIKIF